MTATNWSLYQIALKPQPPKECRPTIAKPNSRPLASVGDRFLAGLIDKLFTVAPIAGAFIFASIARGASENGQTATLRFGVWIFVWLMILIVQAALLWTRGQTLGKMALGVRIVDCEDDSNPGFFRAAVLRSFVATVLSLIPFFGKVFIVADLLLILGDERRCIHDRIADTKVVEA